MVRNICVTAADRHIGFVIIQLLLGELFSSKVDLVVGLVLDASSERAHHAKELEVKLVETKPWGVGSTTVKTLKDTGTDTLCLVLLARHDKKDIVVELINAVKMANMPNMYLISSAGYDCADMERRPHLREFIEPETLLLTSKGDSDMQTGHSPCAILYDSSPI